MFACSGEGAGQAIAQNVQFAYTQVWLAAVLVGTSTLFFFLLHRAGIFPIVCLILLSLHPAWTISALSGDCGQFKALAAATVTLLEIAVVFVQAAVGLRARSWQNGRHRI